MQPDDARPPCNRPVDPQASHYPATGQLPATGQVPLVDPWTTGGPPPYAPPYPPNAPSTPRRGAKGLIIGGVVVVAVLLLAVAGGAIWLAGGSSRHDPGHGGASGDNADASVGWKVGSCIYVSENSWSRPTPSPLSPEMKQIIEQSKRYSPIKCSDPKALAKITVLGATVPASGKLTDDGCPDDTDLAVQQKSGVGPTFNDAGAQVYCTRNVKGPHPGDPGGGAGGLVVGDCVYVGNSDGIRVLNDRIEEEPCAEDYFGKVTARVPDKRACPDGTLSRVAYADKKGGFLCLAQADDKAYIAKPGDCVNVPFNKYSAALKDTCGHGANVYRLVALVDDAKSCPAGSTGRQYTGYDRFLCTKVGN